MPRYILDVPISPIDNARFGRDSGAGGAIVTFAVSCIAAITCRDRTKCHEVTIGTEDSAEAATLGWSCNMKVIRLFLQGLGALALVVFGAVAVYAYVSFSGPRKSLDTDDAVFVLNWAGLNTAC